MTYAFPNPWINETAQSTPPAASPATDVDNPSASVAPNTVEELSLRRANASDVLSGAHPVGPGRKTGSDLAHVPAVETLANMGVTAGETALNSHTKNIVEYFSDYAHRRCMDKVSPPLNREPREFKPDFNALLAAIDVHPRDLDLDPPPLFLRKPRPVFLRALFDLGGVR